MDRLALPFCEYIELVASDDQIDDDDASYLNLIVVSLLIAMVCMICIDDPNTCYHIPPEQKLQIS